MVRRYGLNRGRVDSLRVIWYRLSVDESDKVKEQEYNYVHVIPATCLWLYHINTLTLSSQATPKKPTTFHYTDIDLLAAPCS